MSRRESQLEATLIAGIDCMNGTAFWSSQIFPPRRHGSGAAPLAKLLVAGHGGRIPSLTRAERDLLLAWIDSNGLYHGTWDSTASGCATKGLKATRDALLAEMEKAGCACCHGNVSGKIARFEEDWINLQRPELSRILRAPLRERAEGFGLSLCRDRMVDSKAHRIRQLVDGYAHAVKPVQAFPRRVFNPTDPSGNAVVSFASTQSENYRVMLAIIRRGRELALTEPRVDMPGAEVIPGESRQPFPLTIPERLPTLRAFATTEGVLLSWDHRTDLVGLTFELYRGESSGFIPNDKSHLVSLTGSSYVDLSVLHGTRHYALVCATGQRRSQPIRAVVEVEKVP